MRSAMKNAMHAGSTISGARVIGRRIAAFRGVGRGFKCRVARGLHCRFRARAATVVLKPACSNAGVTRMPPAETVRESSTNVRDVSKAADRVKHVYRRDQAKLENRLLHSLIAVGPVQHPREMHRNTDKNGKRADCIEQDGHHDLLILTSGRLTSP
jgi:hypothetical protein